MKQEDMFEKIKKSAEHVPVPQGLSPENMMKKLQKKKPGILNIYRFGAVAALLAVAITVWKTEDTREQAAAPGFNTEMATEGIRYAEDHKDVYDVLKTYLEENATTEGGWNLGEGRIMIETAAAAPEAAAGADMAVSEESKKIFSDTNVQVEGVDEGDVVKTDGSYIYVLDENHTKISMVKADADAMEVAGTIKSKERIAEFYLYQDSMMVISENGTYGSFETQVNTYDLTDKSKPQLIGSLTQDGSYKNSRSSQGYLYLFTSYWPERGMKKKDTDKYIPRINADMIPAASICIPNVINDSDMIVISSVAWESPKTAADTKAILTSGDQLYVSGNNIYMGTNSYDYNSHQYNYTELLKFSYEKGKIEFKAKTNVDGYLNNQFSLDEYKGYLRVVSTLGHSNGMDTNSLYVYDENLKLTGEIEDLAPGERVYSARLMGDIGYFVTFRNMDPLFSVDLSNPTDPKILGELKITGFSQYLHPYTEGLLWGLGQERDPNTGNYKGLKLSMFDISSPRDVQEQQKLVEAQMEYTPAWDNHKAVLASSSKNLMGFAVEEVNKSSRELVYKYVVYSYDKDKGFEKKLDFALSDYYQVNVRGLFIDQYIYIVEDSRITTFSMEDFIEQSYINY